MWQTGRIHSSYHELYSSRDHNGPERERVRTDGCDHDGGDIRVDHRGSSCCCICCAASRCGHNYAWRTETTTKKKQQHLISLSDIFHWFPANEKKIRWKLDLLGYPLTISLHWSNKSSIKVQVHVGQVWRRASIHNHFIQYLQTKKVIKRSSQSTQHHWESTAVSIWMCNVPNNCS